MALDRRSFDDVCEQDIIDLEEAGVPEGLRIEYKRDLYGTSDDEKREFLKDVSALANVDGGHLILGMDCANGVPRQLKGVEVADPDAALLRLEQILRDGIEPRVVGIRSKAIALAKGQHCLVIRIPKSWNQPHRVCFRNSNRYYLRNSNGVHEASHAELRAMFNSGQSARDRISYFRIQRLQALQSGRGAVSLQAGPRVVIHVMPLSAFAGTTTIDPIDAEKHQVKFRVLCGFNYSPKYNLDGFVNVAAENTGYTQIFRNGIVEAVSTAFNRKDEGSRWIYSYEFENQFFAILPDYISGLNDLGLSTPFVVSVAMQEVADVEYIVSGMPVYGPGVKLGRPEIVLPDCVIDEFGDPKSYSRYLRPVFDALWNASGLPQALSYGAHGTWEGRNFLRR